MKLNWQGVILQGHIQNPPSFKSKNEIQIQEPLTQLRIRARGNSDSEKWI